MHLIVLCFLASCFLLPSLVWFIGTWRLDVWIRDAICDEWIQDLLFFRTLENYSRESSLSEHFLPQKGSSTIFMSRLIWLPRSNSTLYHEQLTNLWTCRCGIISGWWTVGSFKLWYFGAVAFLITTFALYIYFDERSRSCRSVSRVQCHLQLQVNADLLSAFSLTKNRRSSILGLPILDR